MSDNLEIFHSIFIKKGGLFNFTFDPNKEMYVSCLNGYKSYLDTYKDHFKRFPVIHTNFIYNPELNASAGKLNNIYGIGICAGSMILLNELFLRIMSAPNIYTNIGDCSLETNFNPIFNPYFKRNLDEYNRFKAKENLMPVNEIRQFYAAKLTRHALDFLFDHEFAHVIFGHVDLYKAKYHANSIEEIIKTNSYYLDLQSLEMDADTFAAHQAIRRLYLINQGQNNFNKLNSQFYCDFEIGLKNWMFAIYSYYRIFGYQNYTAAELLTTSHPPTGIRIRLIAGTIYEFITNRLNVTLTKDFWEIHHDIIDEVEKSFNEISEVELNRNAIDFAYSDEASKHMSDILNQWNNVRPLLSEFAFGYLA